MKKELKFITAKELLNGDWEASGNKLFTNYDEITEHCIEKGINCGLITETDQGGAWYILTKNHEI